MNEQEILPKGKGASVEANAQRGQALLFVMNGKKKTAAIFRGASCYEELQAMFRVGILLPDGTEVNGIGRCKSPADFWARAKCSELRIQRYE